MARMIRSAAPAQRQRRSPWLVGLVALVTALRPSFVPGAARRTFDRAAPQRVRGLSGEKLGKLRMKAAETSAAGEEGGALSTEGAVGVLGSAVFSLAVLPYVPLSLYSSFLLLTTGAGVPAGPNGVFGWAEGFATLTVLGVSVWSGASWLQRGQGLPSDPFKVLTITQALASFSTACFLFATVVNIAIEPADNPFRGLSTASKPEQLQAAAVKAQKTAQKVSTKVAEVTAPARSELEASLKGAAETTSASLTESSKSASEAAAGALARWQAKFSEMRVPPKSSVAAPAKAPAPEPAPSAKTEE